MVLRASKAPLRIPLQSEGANLREQSRETVDCEIVLLDASDDLVDRGH